jgi:hypothetical protein
MIFAGETEVLGENLPSATLSTTNPTWIDPGANPGVRGERPATNRLSHGTAFLPVTIFFFIFASLFCIFSSFFLPLTSHFSLLYRLLFAPPHFIRIFSLFAILFTCIDPFWTALRSQTFRSVVFRAVAYTWELYRRLHGQANRQPESNLITATHPRSLEKSLSKRTKLQVRRAVEEVRNK